MPFDLKDSSVFVVRRLLTVFLFVLSSPVWSVTEIPDGLQYAIQKAKLLENLDITADALGTAVSIFGDTALVGAANANADDTAVNQLGAGAAYIFSWSAGAWTHTATLTADDGASVDRFGSSVSLSAEWAVVGAPNNSNVRGVGAGAVYVFRFFQGSWTQNQKLLATGGSDNDGFGGSVSVYGNYFAAGASKGDGNVVDSGAVYTFSATHINDAAFWNTGTKLEAPAGTSGEFFGSAVSMTSTALIIGAYGDDEAGENAGAVYFFKRSGNFYSQLVKKLAGDGQAGDWFGWRVSGDGDRALISTAHDDNEAGDVLDMGSAYVFDRVLGTWSQTQKLYPDDSSAFYTFGSSVSLSGDRAVIGNYGDTKPASEVIGVNVGSAYVYELDGSSGNWLQTSKLFAADAANRDEYGRAVALAGERVFVGAPKEDATGEDAGAVYAYEFDGSQWDQTQKISLDPGYDDNHFGYSVSIRDNRAAVGAYGNDFKGEDAGSAAIFELSQDGVWLHTTTLYASDAEAGDQFGFSVSMGNSKVIVGANLEDTEGIDAGAAYIFEYVAPQGRDPYWRQDSKLTAGIASSEFGFSVDITISRALVGAPKTGATGMAYTFRKGIGTWYRTPLTPAGVSEFDNFGYSVSLQTSRLLVGANGDGFAHDNQGAAYVFDLENLSDWVQAAKLTAADGNVSDSFGHSVDLQGDRVIIGAPTMDPVRGAAYIFDRGDTDWQQTQKLSPADETNFGRFGWSVGVGYPDIAIVGAYHDEENGALSGSAYVFNLLNNSWHQTNKFIATGTNAGDNFGNSVGFSNGHMMIGAPQNTNENGDFAGVAYIFGQAGEVISANGFE